MNARTIGSAGAVFAAAVLAGLGIANAAEKKDVTSKTAESSVTTNENGRVSRTFTECTVTTNGNLVTERRRETRTDMDVDGNVLESSTSEYAQSYNVGDTGWTLPPAKATKDVKAPDTDSFMGLKFGTEFKSTNFVEVADEPELLCAKYEPAKKLAGFDDYWVYVTPKSHKVVRVCACAKNAVESGGGSWRRHYLVEALEKRYGTWARLLSIRLPYYAFDVAPDRCVTVCLAGACEEYETVISAWDAKIAHEAEREHHELREEARKSAARRRRSRVEDAAGVF